MWLCLFVWSWPWDVLLFFPQFFEIVTHSTTEWNKRSDSIQKKWTPNIPKAALFIFVTISGPGSAYFLCSEPSKLFTELQLQVTRKSSKAYCASQCEETPGCVGFSSRNKTCQLLGHCEGNNFVETTNMFLKQNQWAMFQCVWNTFNKNNKLSCKTEKTNLAFSLRKNSGWI